MAIIRSDKMAPIGERALTSLAAAFLVKDTERGKMENGSHYSSVCVWPHTHARISTLKS